MGMCQLLAQKEVSVQEGRKGSMEMKIREWMNISYFLLLNISNKEDTELSCTQLTH